MYGFDSTGSYRWLHQRYSLVQLIRLWARLPLSELQTIYGAIMARRFYEPPTRHQKPGKHYRTRGAGRSHKTRPHYTVIGAGMKAYDSAMTAWLNSGRVGPKPTRFVEPRKFAA